MAKTDGVVMLIRLTLVRTTSAQKPRGIEDDISIARAVSSM